MATLLGHPSCGDNGAIEPKLPCYTSRHTLPDAQPSLPSPGRARATSRPLTTFAGVVADPEVMQPWDVLVLLHANRPIGR